MPPVFFFDILDAIAKRPKDAEQKIRMSRKTTKAYWRMVRRMTQTDGFYVSITGWFAIASSIILFYPHYVTLR